METRFLVLTRRPKNRDWTKAGLKAGVSEQLISLEGAGRSGDGGEERST